MKICKINFHQVVPCKVILNCNSHLFQRFRKMPSVMFKTGPVFTTMLFKQLCYAEEVLDSLVVFLVFALWPILTFLLLIHSSLRNNLCTSTSPTTYHAVVLRCFFFLSALFEFFSAINTKFFFDFLMLLIRL